MKVSQIPGRLISGLGNRGWFHHLPDSIYLKWIFPAFVGYPLNLNSPKTFNEKLQWLKINNQKDIYCKWVDKYAVREYVSSIMGEDSLIPLVGGPWEKFEEIDFNSLPNQFVIKCTHDSQSFYICKDKSKLDINKLGKKYSKHLKNNLYYGAREWPYKNVRPRIIAEKYMVDESGYELKDYKFFCFNGNVKFFKIDFDRSVQHHANYYDIDGKILPFGEKGCPPMPEKQLNMPLNLKQMILYAEKFSQNLPFLRVDFYEIDGKIYFGELTLYPAAGLGSFVPSEWDEKIGEWIDLSLVK